MILRTILLPATLTGVFCAGFALVIDFTHLCDGAFEEILGDFAAAGYDQG